MLAIPILRVLTKIIKTFFLKFKLANIITFQLEIKSEELARTYFNFINFEIIYVKLHFE